jgi:hypothetical protein
MEIFFYQELNLFAPLKIHLVVISLWFNIKYIYIYIYIYIFNMSCLRKERIRRHQECQKKSNPSKILSERRLDTNSRLRQLCSNIHHQLQPG